MMESGQGDFKEPEEEQYLKAFAKRQVFHDQPDLNCYRLYHGFCEEEGRPHALSIDRYGSAFLIKTYRDDVCPNTALKAIEGAFKDEEPCVILKKMFRGSSNEEMSGVVLVGNEAQARPVANESGRLIQSSLLGQRNTGLFLDARALRDHVQKHAAGARVLNLFSYTGAFGVAALKGGSKQVVNIDSNKNVHDRARENYTLNGLKYDSRDFVTTSLEQSLRYYKKKGQKFDLVIFDPPPASRRGKKRFRSKRDYSKWLRQVLSVLEPSGMCYALCTDRDLVLDEDRFRQEIMGIAEENGLTEKICEPLLRATDFPAAPFESRLRGMFIGPKEI
ncbi:MAG: class I SAM-dependent methyltransferase [Planctomycetota bacterium]|nr:class I SAM-dependent methyltransferase [Planctomycetota bacterium]